MPEQTQTQTKDERPWWEKARDGLSNSLSKPGGLLRYVQVNEEGLILNTDNIANDFQYEVKRLTNSPDTDYAELTGKTEGSRSSRLVDYVTSNPIMQTVVPGGVDLNTNVRSSTFQAGANAIKAVEDFEKPFGPKDDGLTIEEEGVLDGFVEETYASSGKTPRSQMTDEQLAIDDFKASAALNIYLAAATGGISRGLAGIQGLQQYPRIQQLLNSTNFTASTSKASFLKRFALAQFIDEIPSTYLDDNTGGSGIQLPALIASLAGNQELAQQISALDPVKPGMSRTEASNAAFLPNLATAGVFGGGLVGLGQLGKMAANYVSNPPIRARALRSQAARTARQEARSTLETEGIIQTDETGRSTFTEQAYVPSREGMTAEEQFREANGISQEPSADTTPTPPGLDELPDPSLPEVDGLVETVEANVSDAGLDQILEQGKTGSVVEAVDQVATAERSTPLNADTTYEVTGAPLDSVVRKGDLSNRYSSVPTAQLESLVRNSPELGALVTRQTGKTPDQFTRIDILNGFKELEAEGTTIMPSRLMGSQLLPVSQIEVDPLRFQFKQNVDPASGQQKGNSLDGVDKYNEDMEGSIQVWEDQTDGKTYVVNGHNRLAKARELGVPSMRVEYINAPTAEAARAKGALTNIAQGGGTSIDAAKFLREQGIVKEKQLTDLGIPMKSGLAAKGLALSRLPGNIFQDVVDGRLSETKAMALGASGLDEAGMQQAYKALQDRDLSDGAFNEVLQQAKSAPTVEGSQVDLFGNTETLNLMVDKAKLANAVRQGLSQQRRAAKSAASNVDTLEGVGNQINKEGSLTLADDTAALLERFDADKYMDTATSKLLNQGAQQIAEGGKVKTIANRIRRQLLEAAKNEAAPTRAVEPEVVEPPAVPRKKKIAEIAKMAAQKGEVRPPETPLPETADPGPVSKSNNPIEQVLETTENELRLSEPFETVDNAVAADRLEAQRESIGYDMMTFEQKKQNGLLDGLEEPIYPGSRVMPFDDYQINPDGSVVGDTGLTAAQISKLDNITPEGRARLEADVLSDAKKKNRLQKQEAFNKQNEAANDFAFGDNQPGKYDKASIKLNEAKIQGHAEVLMRYVPSITKIEDAMSIIRRKGRTFYPEKSPELAAIQDQISNDMVMGKTTPEVEKYRAAFKNFYEIDDPVAAPKAQSARVDLDLEKDEFARRALRYLDSKQQAASRPETSSFVIPKDLSKSAPRYSDFQLRFESDLDRAAYMIRNKAKKSKGEDRMIAALEEQGFDIDEVRQLGEDIKEQIKLAAKGYKEVNGQPKILEIPASTVDDSPGIRASRAPGEQTRGYSEKQMRQRLQAEQEIMQSRQASALLDLGTRIPRDVAERAMMSEFIAKDMVAGLKEAARISGADPLRIQYLDNIDMRKMFGDEQELDSLSMWSPDRARFIRENPDDPLAEVARGGTYEGLNVPLNHPSIHRGMIYLAMGPALDNRIARPSFNRRGGQPLARTMYHEAFHSVQTWLDQMAKRGSGGAQIANRALNNSQAIEEMTALIKKDRFSSYSEGMDNVEIQAEAFAAWYLDKSVRLKSPGLQGAFERMKKFINTLRRKWKVAMDKDPTWVDVFEMAAEGKIADVGNQRIAKLTDQQLERLKGRIDSNMDAALPGLTERVEGYLKQKQAEFDLLNEQLRLEADTEGC